MADTPNSAAQDVDEFDAAFKEAVGAAENHDPAPDPVAAQATPEPATPPADDKPLESKPEDKPAQQPGPKDGLEEQLAQALHRERSVANRISAIARENNQLKSQIATLERELQQAKAQPAAATPAAGAKLDDVLADAPDLRAALERRIAEAVAPMQAALDAANQRLQAVDGRTAQVASAVQPLAERDQRRQIEVVFGELDKAYPTWRADIKTPDFVQWLGHQPQPVQRMYDDGVTFDESSAVLRLYYSTKGRSPNPAPQPPAQPAPAAAQPAKADANSRVRQAVGIAPRAVAHPTTNKDDFEGSFNEFVAAKRRAHA